MHYLSFLHCTFNQKCLHIFLSIFGQEDENTYGILGHGQVIDPLLLHVWSGQHLCEKISDFCKTRKVYEIPEDKKYTAYQSYPSTSTDFSNVWEKSSLAHFHVTNKCEWEHSKI